MNGQSGANAQSATNGQGTASPLTKADRDAIRLLLPGIDELRCQRVEGAIRHYRTAVELEKRRRKTPAVRSELRRLLDLSRDLKNGLAKTFSDGDIVAALVFDRPTRGETPLETKATSRTISQAELLRTIGDLDRLIGVLSLATKRVPARKKGASARAGQLYVLVEHLSESVTPNRSGKRNGPCEVIERLCQMADPAVTKSRIEEAIKTWKKVRQARGEK